MFSPHCKLAVRPPYPHMIVPHIRDAYRAAWFGKPGPSFVDLPANLILGHFEGEEIEKAMGESKGRRLAETPKSVAPANKVKEVVDALRGAKRPLVVVGKGAAYARAEDGVRRLVERCVITLPFLHCFTEKCAVFLPSPGRLGKRQVL